MESSNNNEVSIEEIKDLKTAAYRSRKIHIGFGIAALCLLGLFAVSWFTLGGLTAFWAINFTLSLSAIGCGISAIVAKIVNRKNMAKIKILEESYKRNQIDRSKVWRKRSKYLSPEQRRYIKSENEKQFTPQKPNEDAPTK